MIARLLTLGCKDVHDVQLHDCGLNPSFCHDPYGIALSFFRPL